VICHMVTSLDGRIVTNGWPISREASKQYEAIHTTYNSDGWLCGRVTMEQHFAGGSRPESEVAQTYDGGPREDFVAPGEHDTFAFAVDPHGRLAWNTNDIDGDHVVAILSERVSDAYLASLRAQGVSYILAGAPEVDLTRAVEKVRELFGVQTLMLEGGGHINGGMLRAGLIDEISVIVAPVADGRRGEPTLFELASAGGSPVSLTLEHVERRPHDMVWLRYRVAAR